MDSSLGHNINDTLEEPLNNKGGSDGVNQDQLEPTNTLEKPLNNKGGSGEVNQDEAEPMTLSLIPLTPDLQPWKISEESSIIVTPPGISTAGQSSTRAAGNPPLIPSCILRLNPENRPAQRPPPPRGQFPNIELASCRSGRHRRLRGETLCMDCRRARARAAMRGVVIRPRNRR